MKNKADTKAAITTEQTIKIATASNDITCPIALNQYRHADDTLLAKAGGLGLKLYDQIETDPHAHAVLQKRKMAVIARPWKIEAASEDAADIAAAELVTVALENLRFDNLCLDLLDATLKGFAVCEIMWGYKDGHIMPVGYQPVNQRRFTFDLERKPRLLTQTNFSNGLELPERKFIVHRFGAKDGNPFGLGLGSKLYWPNFFKRNGIASWMVFVDKFASPTVVGTYNPMLGKKEQDELLQAVRSVQQEGAVIVPEGAELTLLETLSGAGVATYPDLCRFLDEQISEAVLGETLSTNIGDKGSMAASQTHNDVRGELTDADVDLLADTLDANLALWITELNFPNAKAPSIMRYKPEDEAATLERQNKRAEGWERLTKIGYKPNLEEVQKHFGEGFEVAAPAPASAPAPAFADILHKNPTPEFAAADPEEDLITTLAQQLEEETGQVFDSFITEIGDMVRAAKTGEQVQEGLLKLYAESLEVEPLGDLLTAALVTAELNGMYEVERGE